MVLLRFEWHNPVSWKLKLPPPPGGLDFTSKAGLNLVLTEKGQRSFIVAKCNDDIS